MDFNDIVATVQEGDLDETRAQIERIESDDVAALMPMHMVAFEA